MELSTKDNDDLTERIPESIRYFLDHCYADDADDISDNNANGKEEEVDDDDERVEVEDASYDFVTGNDQQQTMLSSIRRLIALSERDDSGAPKQTQETAPSNSNNGDNSATSLLAKEKEKMKRLLSQKLASKKSSNDAARHERRQDSTERYSEYDYHHKASRSQDSRQPHSQSHPPHRWQQRPRKNTSNALPGRYHDQRHPRKRELTRDDPAANGSNRERTRGYPNRVWKRPRN